MDVISNFLMAGATLGAAVFCLVLSRRLRQLTSLDGGMGTAIAVLSKQVDDLTRALRAAQDTARRAAERLETQTRRADEAGRQLELLLASMHDMPESEAAVTHPTPMSRWNPGTRRPDPANPAAVSTGPTTEEPPVARVLRRRSTTETAR